ncbi:hypothetical protein Btru_077481 [Bulinus truncatus]|nr:hypothetical protein Btru_077481 [Bulinus truncatus]
MALGLWDVACIILFSVELYHLIAHAMILFGIRSLPRKDLVRIRLYFLVDASTVFITSFVLTGKLKWLAVLQILQHLFYFITWNKSYMAKRIIDWSSLEWFKSNPRISPQIDSALGTFFDVFVHAAMMYVLAEQMDMFGIMVAIFIAQATVYSVLYNPKLAWSSPTSVPDWVQKRVGKLEQSYS